MLAGHKSWRAMTSETISFNKPWTRLDSHTISGTRALKITREPPAKTYELDGRSFKRLETARKLPVCLFEPNHLLILSGKPELRRAYLDDLAEQIFPEFGPIRHKYSRVLAQRNHLLKQPNVSSSIFSWNIRLTELAGQIIGRRTELLEKISSQIDKTYQALASSKDRVGVSYSSLVATLSYETDLLKKLETNLDEETVRGYTLYGPHRDDLTISINDKPTSLSASRGEMRTLTLALKILETQIIEEVNGAKPLLLLDDVFSELDGRRRQQLTKYIKSYQTFITTTDADVVLAYFTNSTNIIPLT